MHWNVFVTQVPTCSIPSVQLSYPLFQHHNTMFLLLTVLILILSHGEPRQIDSHVQKTITNHSLFTPGMVGILITAEI